MADSEFRPTTSTATQTVARLERYAKMMNDELDLGRAARVEIEELLAPFKALRHRAWAAVVPNAVFLGDLGAWAMHDVFVVPHMVYCYMVIPAIVSRYLPVEMYMYLGEASISFLDRHGTHIRGKHRIDRTLQFAASCKNGVFHVVCFALYIDIPALVDKDLLPDQLKTDGGTTASFFSKNQGVDRKQDIDMFLLHVFEAGVIDAMHSDDYKKPFVYSLNAKRGNHVDDKLEADGEELMPVLADLQSADAKSAAPFGYVSYRQPINRLLNAQNGFRDVLVNARKKLKLPKDAVKKAQTDTAKNAKWLAAATKSNIHP